jgi:hypothetical protein
MAIVKIKIYATSTRKTPTKNDATPRGATL